MFLVREITNHNGIEYFLGYRLVAMIALAAPILATPNSLSNL